MLRLFFVSTFTDNLMWFDVWEEATELLSVLGIGVVLWVFRETLRLFQNLRRRRASV